MAMLRLGGRTLSRVVPISKRCSNRSPGGSLFGHGSFGDGVNDARVDLSPQAGPKTGPVPPPERWPSPPGDSTDLSPGAQTRLRKSPKHLRVWIISYGNPLHARNNGASQTLQMQMRFGRAAGISYAPQGLSCMRK